MMLTVFGVEMATNEPSTASWASFGTESSEALATPSWVTSPATSWAVVLTVFSAPSRLTFTAFAMFTLMTEPFATLGSNDGDTRSAGAAPGSRS